MKEEPKIVEREDPKEDKGKPKKVTINEGTSPNKKEKPEKYDIPSDKD
jgi:hypothetical protein